VRILGIDPGLRLTGYGCVDARGPEPTLVEAGVFRLKMVTGGKRTPVSDRLLELHQDVEERLARLRPEAVAVEALFAHYKHPATAIAMGHARGVILVSIRKAGLRLIEFKPNEIKMFLTGHGHAGKPQMQAAVKARLRLAQIPEPPDVADAIAIALCGASRAALVS